MRYLLLSQVDIILDVDVDKTLPFLLEYVRITFKLQAEEDIETLDCYKWCSEGVLLRYMFFITASSTEQQTQK